MMTYWTMEPPTKWQAGTVGVERQPIYFSCADCGMHDAEIAGLLSTDGTFQGIGILRGEDGFFRRPAMFCAVCFQRRLKGV